MNHRPNYNPNINVYGTYPRKGSSDFEMMQQSATLDEYNFTPDPQQLRGILRKNREQYPSHPSMFLNSFDYNTPPEPRYAIKQQKKESKWNACFHKVIQPIVAEFIGMAIVQLNPAITITQLFSMNTPWFMCLFLICVQFLGGFSGILLFYSVHTGLFPTLPALVIDTNGDFTSSVFELIICQAIGNFIVCISFLIVTQKVGTSSLYVARLVGNPFSVVSAVALSSFLSLLHSNISYNPMSALVLSTFHYLKGGGASTPWHNHYVFWLGPILGALCSCFIFRRIHSGSNRKKNSNVQQPRSSELLRLLKNLKCTA
ncbi:Major intrinsic protein family and Aquaporin-like domain-containing protein [Aphelenchoides bicaudatus]|nr:Major intrinsic protein family and Aquaporin-like domain-containing protein [Aphelenchoides bicaudatus]